LKALTPLILGAWLLLFVYAEGDIPRPGDPAAPTRVHITPRYIEGSLPETNTPNIVTAVLADYRSYDTLGETAVIFTAGLAVMLILPQALRRGKRR
jgi:multicomponent Na+:H+ antiporter subunit B